jgi:predicted amidohydrolase YtcJ
VILNGNVLTIDAEFRNAEAVAVKFGRIIATGSSSEVKELVGEETQVLDLQSKTMLPGIIDYHVHSFLSAVTALPPLAVHLSSPEILANHV